MKQIVFRCILTAVFVFAVSIVGYAQLPFNTEQYYVDGEHFVLEVNPYDFQYEGMMFSPNSGQGNTVSLTAPFSCRAGVDASELMLGGYYYGVLDIPEKVMGPCNVGAETYVTWYDVTGFYGLNNNGVTRLSLPSKVTQIRTDLYGCQLLEAINIPDEVTLIWGVSDCPRLTELDLPEKLENIGYDSLSEIGVEELKFPPSLRYVYDFSVRKNYRLERLLLGNLVESGDGCFCILPTIREIELPESLVRLGKNNFNYLWNLREVRLPSHPIEMENAFVGCPQLSTVYVTAAEPYECPDFVTEYGEQIVLYVPDGTLDLYKAASGWESVKEIREGGFPAVNSVSTPYEGKWQARGYDGFMKIENPEGVQLMISTVAGESVEYIKGHSSQIIPLTSGVYVVGDGAHTVKVLVK